MCFSENEEKNVFLHILKKHIELKEKIKSRINSYIVKSWSIMKIMK